MEKKSMYATNTLEKMIKALLKTHPNPTPPIQDVYNNSTDKREKQEIKELACSWEIKINEEEK